MTRFTHFFFAAGLSLLVACVFLINQYKLGIPMSFVMSLVVAALVALLVVLRPDGLGLRPAHRANVGPIQSIAVLPLAGREGHAPERFLLQARKDGRAAFRLCPTYVLHRGATHERDQESYTAQTRRILRDGAALHF